MERLRKFGRNQWVVIGIVVLVVFLILDPLLGAPLGRSVDLIASVASIVFFVLGSFWFARHMR